MENIQNRQWRKKIDKCLSRGPGNEEGKFERGKKWEWLSSAIELVYVMKMLYVDGGDGMFNFGNIVKGGHIHFK